MATSGLIRVSLAEILKNSSDDNLRSQAQDSLLGAKSPEASQIIAETAWSQSTKDLYLRSCSYGGVPLSLSAEHSIALKSLTDPRCRRALADSVTFENEDADLSILDNLGLSTDPDVRFNVAYSIGQDLEPSATDNEMRLRPKARERLLRIANNNEEIPEIRRIAATQLHLHAVPMDGLFKALNLPLPTSCHNPGKPGARGGGEGFVFDPYEGRCMYDSRTGCGDGLPEIYTKLRSRLAKGKQWYQWLAFF